MTKHRTVRAADKLADVSLERRLARAELKIEALISAAESHASRLERSAASVAAEVDAAPHLDVEATGAEREARGYSRGFADGLRTAARWAAQAAERARRGSL